MVRRRFVPLVLFAALAAGCGGGLRPHAVAIQTAPGEAVAADRVLVVLDPAALDDFSRTVLTRVIRLEGAPADTTSFLRAFAAALDDAFAEAGVAGRFRVGAGADPAFPADVVVRLENVRAYGDLNPAGKAAARVYRLTSVDLEARVPSQTEGARPAWSAYLQAEVGADTVEALGRSVARKLVAGLRDDGVLRAGGG